MILILIHFLCLPGFMLSVVLFYFCCLKNNTKRNVKVFTATHQNKSLVYFEDIAAEIY